MGLRLRTRADELHLAKAEDGWHVAIWRYAPPEEQRHEFPVVLCHGLGANRFNLDFDDRYSVARYLCRRGFEVYVVELRGTGLAGRLASKRISGRDFDYDFDDHLRKDAPLILERVLGLSGAERVYWGGHSMGGMIGYALMGGEHDDKLAGVVAVGSPGSFNRQHWRVKRAARLARSMFKHRVPGRVVGRSFAPLAGWVRPKIEGPANVQNMDGPVIRRILHNVVDDISRGELDQFTMWLDEGRFCSRDGEIDYLAQLSRSEVPILLIAGGVDRLAPPDSLRDVHDAVGTLDRSLHVLDGYGHGDLILGRRSPEEVFPLISAWLSAH